MDLKEDIRFIRLEDVIRMTTIPKSTLEDMMNKGEFPLPVKLRTRTRVWVEKEILEWMHNLVSIRDEK